MLLSALAQKMGISEDVAEQFLINAPEKYKVYSIPKRGIGFRLIAQPSKELKVYQKTLLNLIVLPINDTAKAYRLGESIKSNALIHSGNAYLLKMDLEDFFNSITPDVFWSVWQRFWELPDEYDMRVIESVTFWKKDNSLVLSIGAPSSPMISNFCLFFFDEEINKFCVKNNISYSRYADDLTFSTNIRNVLFSLPKLIAKVLKENFSGALKINRGKTIFSSKAHNRHVTGITLSNDGKISLGRARKRYIKHKIHHYKLGLLDFDEINHLKGLIAFSKFIEPLFFESLEIKYSKITLMKLME